jgi:hypothetical protein
MHRSRRCGVPYGGRPALLPVIVGIVAPIVLDACGGEGAAVPDVLPEASGQQRVTAFPRRYLRSLPLERGLLRAGWDGDGTANVRANPGLGALAHPRSLRLLVVTG